MIPEFPQFKGLELSDKADVEKVTQKYPPYSDFNFISMWCWDIKGDMKISMLNGNLVVRFTDYINGKPFFSFLGDNMVNETVETLLEFSKKEGLEAKLRLIPEVSVAGLDDIRFVIEEDSAHFDYIYDIEKLKLFDNSEFKIKRNEISKFLRDSGDVKIQALDILDPNIKSDIVNLNLDWLENKKRRDPFFDIRNELTAIDRFLNMNLANFHTVGIFSNNELVAYSINEICKNNFAIGHFYKVKKYNGVFSYLMKKSASFLSDFNIKSINFEQDLGIEGLRRSKKSYKPIDFLKKYIISERVS